MPLVSCKEMISDAYRNGYAIAQLNSNGGTYDLARAILEAAEAMNSPIIVGAYENNCKYPGIDYVGQNLRLLIERFAPRVPVAIHLDHGSSFEIVVQALRAGFTSAMYDGSKDSIDKNVADMARVCEMAHACGMTCEAEIGQHLTGEIDPNNPNIASVEDVKRMVEAVPVDMLAVAIGNSHGFYKGEPKLNIKRLKEIRAVTDTPLVLHGTTGLKEEQVKECVSLGMVKVNLGTHLRTSFVKFYQDIAENFDHMGHPWRIGQQVKERMKAECMEFIKLVGSDGKA